MFYMLACGRTVATCLSPKSTSKLFGCFRIAGCLLVKSDSSLGKIYTPPREIHTSSLLGRVIWSLKRTPKNLRNMPIPKYLKDGSVRRGQGRAGRNNTGRIVVRHRGGGHPQTYRKVDLLRAPHTESQLQPLYHKSEILQIGYDPCRSARIALVASNTSDKFSLIVVPDGSKVGDIITASRGKPESLARLIAGDAHPIQSLPIGAQVHNLELKPGQGPRLVRAAGTFATILRRIEKESGTFVTVKLPSKREKDIDGNCLAVFGRVSNPNHNKEIIGKAGRSRWLGRRPRGRTGVGRWHHWKKRVGCRKKKD